VPTAREYETAIQQLDYDGVRALWERVQGGAELPDPWDQEPGKALEYLIVRAFQLEGADVEWPFCIPVGSLLESSEAFVPEEDDNDAASIDGRTLEQIDGVVHVRHLSALVECKDGQRRCDIAPLEKLRARLRQRPPGVLGIVFSAAGFTRPARIQVRQADYNAILLWSGNEIDAALAQGVMCEGLILKHRQAVKLGIPDYDITLSTEP
jgi:hypothetical protein